jgi:hypothetical protein
MRWLRAASAIQALAGVVDRLRWWIKRGDGGNVIRWRFLVVVSLPVRTCPELPFKNPVVEGKQPESADDRLAVTNRAVRSHSAVGPY